MNDLRAKLDVDIATAEDAIARIQADLTTADRPLDASGPTVTLDAVPPHAAPLGHFVLRGLPETARAQAQAARQRSARRIDVFLLAATALAAIASVVIMLIR